ncbi:MAG: DUF4159 domain-containing protein [Planctomycetaceae bacterium]|nr:DUF4159 domain-containing protein [Planctomycetaceae bacterium]
MMVRSFAVVLGALLLLSSPVRADIDAEQVRRAIDRGVAFLKEGQNNNGGWPEGFTSLAPSGVSALCTLALINAGVPLDDPVLSKAIQHVRGLKLDHTYSVSLQTMVLCAADPQRDMLKINENVKWLESHQRDRDPFKGVWGYTSSTNSGDNSNAQFAMLALYEAARVGVPLNEQVLRKAEQWWLEAQAGDGSWGYVKNHHGTGSMTCAGIGAMVMIRERLSQGDAKIENNELRCCGAQDSDAAIERGLAWLGRKFSVHGNPGMNSTDTYLYYFLYGVERVGRLTNRRFIGGHDWYREGAEFLVQQQANPPGSWRGTAGESNQHVATSLALLFLAKGRRAVVVARLKHEPDDDWNPHRRDLANLVNYVEQRWRRDLTWQVIDIGAADASDLMQTPVLMISGKLAPRFTPDQIALLRKYIDLGGFIFAENCCSDDRFDDGIRRLAAAIFPEPEYQLRLLDAGHPLWTAEERVDANYMPPLYGVDYGCRTCFVYANRNLGCYWELAVPGKAPPTQKRISDGMTASLSVGINVLAYATNRELKYKLDAALDVASNDIGDRAARGRMAIAKLKHNGGWNVAPSALPNLLRTVEKQTGLMVAVDRREVTLLGDQLKNYHVVFMHGRNEFSFSPEERKALKEYLERGGMIVADAVCASEAFSRAMRRELLAVFPEVKLEAIPATHPLYTNQFGGFDLRKVTLRKPDVRRAGEPLKAVTREQPPELEGLPLGDRYAVVFSPYDLSCALERHDSLECTGYIREDAAKIGLNIILYSLH